MLSLLCMCLFPTSGHSSSKTQSIGSVKVDNTKVFSSPKLGSTLLKTLKKGEEFPIISSSVGDSAGPIIHKVKTGNTLWKVANQYGVSVSELQKVNKLSSSEIIVGQNLKIPQKYKIHKVVSGDTLWKISNKYKVTTSDLTKLNNLRTVTLKVGQKLKVPEYYYQVQLLGGKKGWIKKSQLQNKAQNRIVMGWKHNGSKENYTQQLKHPNLNVVSPRSYTLTDTGNYISVSVDTKYIQAAHKQGKQVWQLIGNKFDPVLTGSVLGNTKKRQKLVSALRDSLVKTKSDGINVDFENIDPKNKKHFVLFIGELKKALKPHGIIVSVDVTRENDDPFWSKSLDRKALGKIADYIIIMGYDEHWGGSPVAGSVSSLPWIKEGTKLLMKEVPAHKIILAVPFYTREWETDLSTKKVKSHDRTMAEVNKIISTQKLKKVWDKKTQQNYVVYTSKGKKHQIWIEDKKSMKLRIDLVKQNHLGGAAAWYIGSETPDIWDVYHFNQ
ncbi:LysM peptidoglycan-binding domain-containing protein [Peribacillus frigoritolerans]|uniref:LysM peptidoglycan-binding domain-containing protein n=1 Tax=Peribacillus frigoritolerans TaxID=450367 RepID=UPI0020BD5AA8|nr:LysM peptidoglycan-binding domain-containing protein [Peribacillus frigoritolerans]